MADTPTLAELRERLAGFQEAFRQCSQIDSWLAVVRCEQENQQMIDRLKLEIERREGQGDA